MLKTIRILLALCVFIPLTLLFLDCYEVVPASWHQAAHCQFTPAFFAALGSLHHGSSSAAVFTAILFATLLFGRLYCSVLCPFGIMQDIISRIGKAVISFIKRNSKPKHTPFKFRKELKIVRYPLMLLFLAGLFVPAVFISVILLDPYSNYGRITTAIVRPLFIYVNNLFAGLNIGDITLRNVSVHTGTFVFITALFFFILAGALSFFFGRRYCNTVCPVGTFLGLLSKISVFKIWLNSNCVSCGLCEKVCKGECIDSKNKSIDNSRCVECFNCLSACKKNAITFSIKKTASQQETAAKGIRQISMASMIQRRSFIRSVLDGLTAAGAAVFIQQLLTAKRTFGSAVSSKTSLESLPTATSTIPFERNIAVLPPGAKHIRHFQNKCTGCHLCVAKCPANVLVPSTGELGFNGLLQPVVKFEHGFCNYHCTICSKVCPTHALLPINTKEEKHLVQIGQVIFIEENCVVKINGTNCGACGEHCPTGAIEMKSYGDPALSLTLPVIHPELCIGCGACENICPVRPYKAVYIEGLEKQGRAKPAVDPNEKPQEVQKVDFGF